MEKPRVLVDIQCAKDALANAESHLARLLRETQGATRAEKTTISGALRDAFQKLRAARERAIAVEKLARR